LSFAAEEAFFSASYLIFFEFQRVHIAVDSSDQITAAVLDGCEIMGDDGDVIRLARRPVCVDGQRLTVEAQPLLRPVAHGWRDEPVGPGRSPASRAALVNAQMIDGKRVLVERLETSARPKESVPALWPPGQPRAQRIGRLRGGLQEPAAEWEEAGVAVDQVRMPAQLD
jgi:hypothetical protein